MEGSSTPPDSWEVADLDASMRSLLLSNSTNTNTNTNTNSNTPSQLPHGSEAINSVDHFLREAIQNPRERLSVLRMEKEIEKFVKDPTRQQLEFQQLPTSYLRLAAHRLAQHYSLMSMVLMDNSLPDGSGTKIIVQKTSECRIPPVRLSDIPVNFPTDGSGVAKIAIKQRPQRGSQNANSLHSHSGKGNSSKSVEERKEEYNRARARIFNSSNTSGGANGKQDSEPRTQDIYKQGTIEVSKQEDKFSHGGPSDLNMGRAVVDPSGGTSRASRNNADKEPITRSRSTNKVAIVRDRETDRNDPDYDRSYDRYMQRFDPGFGFNGGPYPIQPMYAPAVNYNTEFPHLGAVHRPPVTIEHQHRSLPQHLPGPWCATSTPAGITYGLPENMIPPFNPNVGGRSNSGIFLHSSQYSYQHPGMPFIHPHEQVQLPFQQYHQQEPDLSFSRTIMMNNSDTNNADDEQFRHKKIVRAAKPCYLLAGVSLPKFQYSWAVLNISLKKHEVAGGTVEMIVVHAFYFNSHRAKGWSYNAPITRINSPFGNIYLKLKKRIFVEATYFLGLLFQNSNFSVSMAVRRTLLSY
ncbi:hypothetical protein LIER_25880 [Lithospermum erythrorhizon]|uniref:Uncharacterized protein n=1 Tax=Lithospermum erythrorhizon TaxID=34254 RepID=A0AAV3R7X7_LITER